MLLGVRESGPQIETPPGTVRPLNGISRLKTKPPSKPVDGGAFEERAAIIHEAHTSIRADDGTPLPEPIFEITQEQVEKLAAQEHEGPVFAQGPARIPRAQEALLGTALLGTRLFLHDQRQCHRRCHTSVYRAARR